MAITAAGCALLLGCGGGDDGDSETTAPQATEGTKLWFTAGEQFHTVERDPADAGRGPGAAVRALLAGPSEKERRGDVATDTQIPEGVSLEGLDVADDGTAVVKLSPEFTGGIPTEPSARDRDQQAELDARVAQVTYTLTQFKDVEDARVVSGGTPVAGGVDRQDYAAPATRSSARSCSRGRCPSRPGCPTPPTSTTASPSTSTRRCRRIPPRTGCVRVPAPEAKGVYDFATIGTVVVVF